MQYFFSLYFERKPRIDAIIQTSTFTFVELFKGYTSVSILVKAWILAYQEISIHLVGGLPLTEFYKDPYPAKFESYGYAMEWDAIFGILKLPVSSYS